MLTNWKDPTHKDPTRISLTVFPVSSDRFRLGYSYRLSWGGNPEYRPRDSSPTPGVEAPVRHRERSYAFVGAKSAVILDRRTAEQKSRARRSWPAPASIRPRCSGSRSTAATSTAATTSWSTSTIRRSSCSAPRPRSRSTRACRSQSSVDYKLYKYNNERVSGLFDPVEVPGRPVVARDVRVHGARPDPQGPGEDRLDQGPDGHGRRPQRPRDDRPHRASASTPATATSRSSCTRSRACRRTRTSRRQYKVDARLLRGDRRRPELERLPDPRPRSPASTSRRP